MKPINICIRNNNTKKNFSNNLITLLDISVPRDLPISTKSSSFSLGARIRMINLVGIGKCASPSVVSSTTGVVRRTSTKAPFLRLYPSLTIIMDDSAPAENGRNGVEPPKSKSSVEKKRTIEDRVPRRLPLRRPSQGGVSHTSTCMWSGDPNLADERESVWTIRRFME